MEGAVYCWIHWAGCPDVFLIAKLLLVLNWECVPWQVSYSAHIKCILPTLTGCTTRESSRKSGGFRKGRRRGGGWSPEWQAAKESRLEEGGEWSVWIVVAVPAAVALAGVGAPSAAAAVAGAPAGDRVESRSHEGWGRR
eukprot:scaffold51648_cov21-Tisochrysis_lutea.AAC.2